MKQSIKTIISIVMAFTIAIICMPMSMASKTHYSGTCGDNLTWTLDTETGELVISGEGEMWDYYYNGGTSDAPWNSYDTFEGNTIVKSVIVKNGVTSIGNYAFIRCLNLEKVVIADTVVRFGWNVFSYSIKLADITIGNNITNIDADAFTDTGYYNDISNWENGILYLDNYLLRANEDVSGKVVIKNGTTIIAGCAFSSCDKVDEIIIPNSVEYVGGDAFGYCDALKSITFSDKLVQIMEYTFENCNSLRNITIPENVTCIREGAFNGCQKLESVKLGDGITSIGAYAFDGCESLADISIGNNVQKIGNHAFYNTAFYNDESNWEDGVLYIDECLIATKEVYEWDEWADWLAPPSGIIKDGTKVIADYAYDYSTDNFLENITIPVSITNIGAFAFNYCSSLTDVCFKGTENEWNEIIIGEGNEPLLNATINFLGESEHKHELAHRTVASTCTVAGMEYDICLECGESFNIVTLPLAAHSWSKWMTRTEATGSAYGEKYRTCTVCGKEETDSIPKLNVIEDEKTGIEIEFDNEYNSGVEIKVEEVFDGNSFELLEKAYGGVKTKVFDISTIKDGIKVQPNGKVKVRIPLPNGFGKNPVWVNYIDSVNGTVTKIPSTVVNGYVEFETDHFSYYAVVEELSKVNSVSIDSVSMNYKDTTTITPSINADAGVKYTISYSSSDTGVAQVDANGKVTATGKGNATITVTVTDEYGNTVTDTCNVEVKYTFWQWLIVIVLFGWIWY